LTAREAEMRRAAEKYASDLTEFIQEHSLSVMAVLIPSQIQLDADYADGLRISNGVSADGFEPSLPRKIAREALDSVGVPYIDACESMADAYTPDMFYVRDAHMTPLGMRALMRCVRPEFKEWCR
jgi:hypothetical protein